MKKLLLYAVTILLLTSLMCGCAESGFSDMLEKNGTSLDSCSVYIYFKEEMEGGVDVYTLLEGDRASSFISALFYSEPIKEPEESYSPPMSASHEIVMRIGDEDKLTVYYDDTRDWLVIPDTRETKAGMITEYRFYDPDPVFGALVKTAYESRVSTDSGNTLETSSLVLRASVTSDMLGQAGTNVDYELYTGSYAYTDPDPFYHIYTSAELPDELSDSQGLVIASLGTEPTTGYAIYISSIDYTDYLIRVTVYTETPEYPDDEEAVSTSPYVMATCDLDDFPLGLTVVFIDQNYSILGVETIDVP